MSICQKCARKIGTCNWERNFTPVPGWNAMPTVLNGQVVVKGTKIKRKIQSYKVIECPLFVPPNRGKK